MDVDLEQDASPLERHRRHRVVHGRRRVVDQDLDRTTQGGDGLGHDPGPIDLVGEVGDDDGDRGAVATGAGLGLPQRAGQVVVVLEGAGDQGDVGPLGRQPLGDGGPDAAAGPGDERPSAGEPVAHDARPLAATKPARHSPM